MAILPPPDVSLPPAPGRPGGWGALLESTLVRFFGRLLNSAKEAIGGMLRYGLEIFLEAIEPNLIALNRPILTMISNQPGLPAETQELIQRLLAGEYQVGSLLLSSAGSAAVGTVTGNVLNSLLAPLTYQLNRGIKPARLDFPTLWRADNRRGAQFADMINQLLDQGWSTEQIHVARAAAEVRPGPSELMQLYLRGEIGPDDLRTRLQQEGIPGQYFDEVVKLAQQIPGPGDLVRFALREAWSDPDANKYGYDESPPPQFGQWMSKQGYDPEWAKLYWRAHWQLPSISAGFEMLHRGEIDPQTLDDLLRLNDFPAYWRKRLANISYAPYTRVDVRRMHELGILNPQQVYDSYRDIGYDHEKATNMTRFTIAYMTEEDRALTKTDIVNAYRDGIIEKREATTMLVDLGYSGDNAAFLLARADMQRETELQQQEIAIVGKLFKAGDVDTQSARQRLTALGLPLKQIDLLIEAWNIDRTSKTSRPTRAQVEGFYKEGVITHTEFVSQLTALGYQDQYIGWYLASIALARQKEAEDTERKARAEQDKLRERTEATAYQRDTARLDVDIRELETAIARANVGIVEAQNERDNQLRSVTPQERIADLEDEYLPIFHEADAAISTAKVEIARAKEQIGERQKAINTIRQSMAENIDVAQRIELQRDIANREINIRGIEQEIAAYQTAIKEIKEIALTLDDPEQIDLAKQDIAALETDIAQLREGIAAERTAISEAGLAMYETLSPERKAELENEQRDLDTQIADLQHQIDRLNTQIVEITASKGESKAMLDAAISRLPGAAEAAAIRAEFDSQIDALQAQIKRYRANIAELRLTQANLKAEYREG